MAKTNVESGSATPYIIGAGLVGASILGLPILERALIDGSPTAAYQLFNVGGFEWLASGVAGIGLASLWKGKSGKFSGSMAFGGTLIAALHFHPEYPLIGNLMEAVPPQIASLLSNPMINANDVVDLGIFGFGAGALIKASRNNK